MCTSLRRFKSKWPAKGRSLGERQQFRERWPAKGRLLPLSIVSSGLVFYIHLSTAVDAVKF